MDLGKWAGFFNRFLGHVPDAVRGKVVGAIRKLAGKKVADELAPLYARGRVKMIDAIAAATAMHMGEGDAKAFVAAYIRNANAQELELANALVVYGPLALAVEQAKAAHGDPSPEVAAARAQRKAFLATIDADAAKFFEALAEGAGA